MTEGQQTQHRMTPAIKSTSLNESDKAKRIGLVMGCETESVIDLHPGALFYVKVGTCGASCISEEHDDDFTGLKIVK